MTTPPPKIELRRRLTAADYNPSNTPGTCLWCGRELRRSARSDNRGDYGDNAFCGLRCGYSFGVIAARDGTRMKPLATPRPQEKRRRLPRWPKCPSCRGQTLAADDDYPKVRWYVVCQNKDCEQFRTRQYVDSYETRRLLPEGERSNP